MEKLNINQWSADDRPREKFMERGAEALTNAELLAILIGSGNTKETAVDLMKRILADCDDKLNVLGRKTMEELTDYNGIGAAKAITILAACELGRRRQSENVDRLKMDSASSIYLYLHPKMQDLGVEQAWVLLMNQNFKLIKGERLSVGGISETSIDVRQVLKLALINNATVLAIAHNHPSNNPRPSRDDDRITERMKKACDIMRIHFLDHVIVTDGQYYSYHEQGRL
ncbi:MAG: DNA repair protein RadC [Prevotella sp.]|nr:DNA repair protein RadC [Prevotella sp.]